MDNLICKKHGVPKSRAPKGGTYCKLCIKEYRDAKKDKIKAYLVSYRENHRLENVNYQRSYRDKFGDVLLEKKKIKYAKEHPDMKGPSKYGNISEHPDYVVWCSMKARCYNPNDKNYPYWGGRKDNPIKVCDRWLHSFENFLDDMGPRKEPGLTIERLRNNEDYKPDNCIWDTRKAQANNRRSNIKVRISTPENSPIQYPFGNLITLKEFAEKVKLPLIVAKYRYAQFANPDWILDKDCDGRIWKYDEHWYNVSEISIMTGIKYSVIHTRLNQLGWTVAEVIARP